jgi:hypothetical protein
MFQLRQISMSLWLLRTQSACRSRAEDFVDELCGITSSLDRTGLGVLGFLIRFLVFERRSVPVAQFGALDITG